MGKKNISTKNMLNALYGVHEKEKQYDVRNKKA